MSAGPQPRRSRRHDPAAAEIGVLPPAPSTIDLHAHSIRSDGVLAPIELVRACARAAQNAQAGGGDSMEAQIYTFLQAAGGVGVTTLAIQTALLLQGGKGSQASVCLVDLDFQHGAVADYLDIEPRLDLNEIEPRPERLDRQLLEVMLSRHSSGLQVIAAPSRPAEMRSFDPLVVTRLLDLVSANFDYVVIDMPRTWFSWTDDVLLGSNQLFIVSEMTVPTAASGRRWSRCMAWYQRCSTPNVVHARPRMRNTTGLRHTSPRRSRRRAQGRTPRRRGRGAR